MRNCLSLFVLPFLFVSLFGVSLNAQTESKHYEQSYAIEKKANLIIDTEFADVKIIPHDKPEIVMQVDVKVTCSKAENAKKMIEHIDVGMKQSGNDVALEVELGNRLSNVELDVQVTIKAPVYVNLSTEMEYGNLNLNEITGRYDIGIEFGAVTVGKLLNDSPDNRLNLEYCEPVIIGIMKKGKINADFSDVKLKAAGDVRISGDYTDYFIGKAIAVHAHMDFGSLSVQEVAGISFQGDYVAVQLEKVLEQARFEMDFGSLNIQYLDENFENLIIESDYLDASVNLGKLEGFVIDGYLEYTDVDVPDFVTEKSVDYTGTELSGGKGEAMFKIEMEFGSLKIK